MISYGRHYRSCLTVVAMGYDAKSARWRRRIWRELFKAQIFPAGDDRGSGWRVERVRIKKERGGLYSEQTRINGSRRHRHFASKILSCKGGCLAKSDLLGSYYEARTSNGFTFLAAPFDGFFFSRVGTINLETMVTGDTFEMAYNPTD